MHAGDPHLHLCTILCSSILTHRGSHNSRSAVVHLGFFAKNRAVLVLRGLLLTFAERPTLTTSECGVWKSCPRGRNVATNVCVLKNWSDVMTDETRRRVWIRWDVLDHGDGPLLCRVKAFHTFVSILFFVFDVLLFSDLPPTSVSR